MDTTSWGVGGGGWITLPLINAGLAEQKNRSRLGWFLLALLIGALATLLIVVMRPPV
ncbi:MAG: hypothetical protein ABIS84_07925 [Arachnia sp.]